MDIDLSARYNEGLVPAPELESEPGQLPLPAWQPAAAEVEQARQQLRRNLAILGLLLLVIFVVLTLTGGWRP